MKESDWQPIATVPRTGKLVLVGRDGMDVIVGWAGSNGFFSWPGCISLEPTHWMPLPAAPAPATEAT